MNEAKTMKHPQTRGYGNYSEKLPCSNPDCHKVDGHEVEGPHNHDYLGRAGTGRLERKASGELVYHAPWTATRKPFTMPALKARVDKPGKAIERMKADILKSIAKMDSKYSAKTANMAGRACVQGWKIIATDGHRALLEPGQGTGDKSLDWLGTTKGYRFSVIADPEFHLALKRAMVAANEIKPSVKIIGRKADSTVTLSSCDQDIAFDETLALSVAQDFHSAFNPLYLEPMPGTWPLKVWFKDTDSAMIFEASDGSFRYVVMPLRDTWTDEEIGIIAQTPIQESATA